jgi:hypothetical protein
MAPLISDQLVVGLEARFRELGGGSSRLFSASILNHVAVVRQAPNAMFCGSRLADPEPCRTGPLHDRGLAGGGAVSDAVAVVRAAAVALSVAGVPGELRLWKGRTVP